MYVRNAMTSEIHVCHAQDSLQRVAEMMRVSDCGAIPVVDNNQHPIGIITDRDIAMFAAGGERRLSEVTSNEIIKDQKVIFCHDDDNIDNALQIMALKKVRRLLVINGSGRLAGILTLGDIAALTDVPELHGDHINPKKMLNFLKAVSAHHPSPIMLHPN